MHYLRYWHPSTGAEYGAEVAIADEIVSLARRAREFYEQEASHYLPGVSLWRGPQVPENSLGISVARFGWAIVHTGDDYFQRCSRSTAPIPGPVPDTLFDQSVPIPASCFLAESDAIDAVATWMNSGQLSERVMWSDDLYG